MIYKAVESVQQAITNENIHNMFSGVLQALSDNTPDFVSETWDSVENPYYVAAGAAAVAHGLACISVGLYMCYKRSESSNNADENKKVSESEKKSDEMDTHEFLSRSRSGSGSGSPSSVKMID